MAMFRGTLVLGAVLTSLAVCLAGCGAVASGASPSASSHRTHAHTSSPSSSATSSTSRSSSNPPPAASSSASAPPTSSPASSPAAPPPSSTSSAGPAPTTIITYYPSQSTATATESGNCWTGSIASERSDAYRCMTGNNIYDPCFLDGSQSVFCPTDVPPRLGVVLTLTAPLPATGSEAPGQAPPWAFQLADGAICQVVTGAGIANFPFACSSGLFCEQPSAPTDGVVSTACGMSNGSGSVPSSAEESISDMWR